MHLRISEVMESLQEIWRLFLDATATFVGPLLLSRLCDRHIRLFEHHLNQRRGLILGMINVVVSSLLLRPSGITHRLKNIKRATDEVKEERLYRFK